MVFYDDFAGGTLNPQWTALNRRGDNSNGEQECYEPANVTLSGSNLQLTVRAQTATCSDTTNGTATFGYTSGAVQMSSFSFLYGTVEVRTKFTGGTGPWPAFWMLGHNCQQVNISTADNVPPCNWDASGSDEIDVAEVLGSHLFTVNEGIFSNGTWDHCGPVLSDVSQNWHTYDLVWSPGVAQWFVDGTLECTKTNATVHIPSEPMFVILDVAIGGQGGTIDNATLPQTMLVDYVKVTQ